MNIVGWPTEIRPAGQARGTDPGQWPPTTVDGQNLVLTTMPDGCVRWRTLSLQQKIDVVRRWWVGTDWAGLSRGFAPAGMDIAHPGWEQQYIAQADAYCANQSRLGPSSPWPIFSGAHDQPSDAQIAQFLGTRGYNCGSWERLTLQKKRFAVAGNAPASYSTDNFVHRVDAYCLKLAFQRSHAPTTARPYASLRPAGQVTQAPAGISPMTAGVIGFAIGGVVSFLVLR